MRLLLLILLLPNLTWAEIGVTVRSLKDATHIEFSGLGEWRYNKSTGQDHGLPYIDVEFDGIKPEELTALKVIKDSRVKSVELNQKSTSGTVVRFNVTDIKINLFDYQTDSPTNLIFDFYKEEAKPKKIVQQKSEIDRSLRTLVQKSSVSKKRKPASDISPSVESDGAADKILSYLKDGIFDGGDKDFKRFKIEDNEIQEKALIKSSQNIYLKFPEVIKEHPYLQNLLLSPVQYSIEGDGTEENRQVRLVLRLFKEAKYAVVLRTLKFVYEKFPDTKYKKDLEFIEADTYYNLWLRDKVRADLETAIARYKELIEKYPEDPHYYRTTMIIGLSYLDIKNYFGALSVFQRAVQRQKDSPYYWQMRMAVAEALRSLNKYDAALDEMQSIENDSQSGAYGIEARYRRGDVYFRAEDYENAISEYKKAIAKYSKNILEAPNSLYNMGEAQFRLKRYKESLETLREFLQKFPSHQAGGFAMTRIGEILEILGAPQQRVAGAYLESYFRFRGSPGAYLAKVHINAPRFGEMKDKELTATRKEFIDETPKIEIEHLHSFLILQESDGLLKRKDFKESFEMAKNYYQNQTTSPYLDIFKNRIIQNITEQVNYHNEQKNYVKAVETYLKNQPIWLNKSNRIDTRYYLAHAYEKLNILDEAEKNYKQCISSIDEFKEQELKAAQVFQKLPTLDELNLRLAKVSVDANQYKVAADHLKEIKKPSDFSEEQKVERILILAAVAEKQERFDIAIAALKDLTEHWRGKPELLIEPWYRLAKINKSLKKYDSALDWLNKVSKLIGENNENLQQDLIRNALELKAELYTALKQWDQAAETYNLIIEKHHANKPLGSVRYELGKIYFDQKRIREASLVWSELRKDKQSTLWSKMAEEQLTQSDWNERFKKYVGRKPAGGK